MYAIVNSKIMALTKEQYKETLHIIVEEIKKVVALIMEEGGGREKEARERFNKCLYEKYHQLFWEQHSPFTSLFFLYDAIDEYLNNEGARILGAASKKRILGEYSEFEENTSEVRARIEALPNEKTASV